MSLLVVTYLFLGGSGAGALLGMIILDLISPQASKPTAKRRDSSVVEQAAPSARSRRSYLPQVTYRPFFLPGFFICTVMMALGILCLFFDLGRPDRVLNLFLNPTLSYLTLGAFTLTCALVCAGFLTLLWSRTASAIKIPRWLVRMLEGLGLVSAASVIVYTGLLLYSMGTGTFLGSPFIPILFALSALSCGIALIIAALGFTDSIALFNTTLRSLTRLDSVLLVFELLALAALLLIALADNQPYSNEAAQTLVWGSEAPVFWLVLVGGGLLLPLVLENIPRLSLSRGALSIALAVLAGGFALRWCLVEVGLSTVILGA